MNLVCELPNIYIGVMLWEPHPCGGYHMPEAWCYGPQGRIGYWLI